VEFRCPDILDSDPSDCPADTVHDLRIALEHSQATLHRTREYGRALWTQLDEARRYLMEDVAGGEDSRQPTMLKDKEAWRSWVDLFARLSAVLAGAHGDQSLGRSEATLVARAHGVEIGPNRG
jgi:hypothetical protein